MSGLQIDACASSSGAQKERFLDFFRTVVATHIVILTRNERLREDTRPLEPCLRASTGHNSSGKPCVEMAVTFVGFFFAGQLVCGSKPICAGSALVRAMHGRQRKDRCANVAGWCSQLSKYILTSGPRRRAGI